MNLKQIIRGNCACYFSHGPGRLSAVTDWCEVRDGRCIAFSEFKRCKYFEEGVLPDQPDASAEYAELVRSGAEGTPLGVGRKPQKARRVPQRGRQRVGRVGRVPRSTPRTQKESQTRLFTGSGAFLCW